MYKKIFSLIAVLMLVFASGGMAADNYFTGYDVYDADYILVANENEVYFPGDNNSQVVILSIDVTTPAIVGGFNVYDKESELSLSKAIGIGTTGFVTATNPALLFDYGDRLIIQTAGGAVQYRIANNMVTAAAPYSITMSAGTSSALAVGTDIYEMELIATLNVNSQNAVGRAVGSSQRLESSSGIIAGTKDSPLLMSIVGGVNTATTIYSVFGTYK
jgi:hypothetical protein